MSERDSRPEGVGEHEAGVLPGQEYDEGVGGGPASMGDDGHGPVADDAIALDELPEPEGDPVELDDLREAQEEVDALGLVGVRAALAELSEPEGSPYEAEGDAADEDYEDEADAEDYDEAEAEDYDDSSELEGEAVDDTEVESDYDGARDGE